MDRELLEQRKQMLTELVHDKAYVPMKAKSFWHSDGLADDKKECALAHSRAERGRLRQTSSSRECASLAGRAFLCTREFQRNFLVHKKDCPLRPVDRKSSLFDIIMKIEEISLLLLRM